MKRFRQVMPDEDTGSAVTIGIERNADGDLVAAVWWPSHGDVDADEVSFGSVPEAIAAAEAAAQLHGFNEIVVVLQTEDLWQAEWGDLARRGPALSEEESFELARATEASRDA